eukprot:s459_g25.t1
MEMRERKMKEAKKASHEYIQMQLQERQIQKQQAREEELELLARLKAQDEALAQKEQAKVEAKRRALQVNAENLREQIRLKNEETPSRYARDQMNEVERKFNKTRLQKALTARQDGHCCWVKCYAKLRLSLTKPCLRDEVFCPFLCWMRWTLSSIQNHPSLCTQHIISRQFNTFDIFSYGSLETLPETQKKLPRCRNDSCCRFTQKFVRSFSPGPGAPQCSPGDPQMGSCKLSRAAVHIQLFNGNPPKYQSFSCTKDTHTIQGHSFFKSLDWSKVVSGRLPPPFPPQGEEENYQDIPDSEADAQQPPPPETFSAWDHYVNFSAEGSALAESLEQQRLAKLQEKKGEDVRN